MVSYSDLYAKTYKPGDHVEPLAVYTVTHDEELTEKHEVTAVRGR